MQKFLVENIYPLQIESGAEIHFISRSDFYNLVKDTFPDGWQPNDFWLFDKTSGIEQFYTDDFEYKDDAPISATDLPKYVKLRDTVLQSNKIFDVEEYKARYLK
jgi:hypothetical protein